MDAITLAAIVSAVKLLGTKVAEGAASEAGKAAWGRLRGVFGWENELVPSDLAVLTARHLEAQPERVPEVLQILKQGDASVRDLVGHIVAEKVVVAQKIRTVKM